MNHAEDTDILTRLRLADPVDLVQLERIVAPLRARVKQRAIEKGSVPSEPIPVGDRVALEAVARRGRGRSGRRRWPALGFASLACAAFLAAVIVFSAGSIDPVGNGAYPGFAEAAVKVAEANPRLLVTAPGWKVVEARSFRTTDGQLYLADGKKQIHLWWMPAAYYQEVLRRSHRRDGQVGASTIAGREATTIHDDHAAGGGSYFETVFPPEGGVFVAFDGTFEERGEWKDLMASVRSVGVEAWLEAMPAEILRPAAISGEITRMLHGVPVPPGFDAAAAVRPTQLTNRFQAAKNLTERLTCSWVERWSAARGSGDAAVAEEAVEAMSGAAHWPVLLQMVREKGYRGGTLPAPGYLWPTSIITIGRQMAAGHLERERTKGIRDGRVVTTGGFRMPKDAYPPDALTCFPPPGPP